MDLRQYLFNKRMKIVTFAEEIGYSPVYISGVMRGKLISGKKFRLRVFTCTGGEVGFETWKNRE